MLLLTELYLVIIHAAEAPAQLKGVKPCPRQEVEQHSLFIILDHVLTCCHIMTIILSCIQVFSVRK